MFVVATAGHVDHGKSSLVKALCGTDPDRLEEEKRRGLTIDLGFAATSIEGETIAFVDVPGHSRFLKNMLAGVGSVGRCLFVVAANEGWMPQSQEHLSILRLLGVLDIAVAVTKADLVDAQQLVSLEAQLAQHFSRMELAPHSVTAVDSLSGRGLDRLRGALLSLCVGSSTRRNLAPANQRVRVWIDRCFAAKGAGTVVTGTLTGSRLDVGDELVLWPSQTQVRVRALQSIGQQVSAVGPDSRVALNLVGIHYSAVSRGMVLVRPREFLPARVFDAAIEVLEDSGVAIGRRGAFVCHIGTLSTPVTFRVLGGQGKIEPGANGIARLYFPHDLPLGLTDRFVIRDSGTDSTVAGGQIIEVNPIVSPRTAPTQRPLDWIIENRQPIRAADLFSLTGVRVEPNLGHLVVSELWASRRLEELESRVRDAGQGGLEVAVLEGVDRELLRNSAKVSIKADLAIWNDFESSRHWQLLVRLEGQRFTPDPVAGEERRELRQLVQRGLVHDTGDLCFAHSAVIDAALVVRDHLNTAETLSVAELRDALGVSRKFTLGLLAVLDSLGATRRRGETRVAGPGLAQLTSGTSG